MKNHSQTDNSHPDDRDKLKTLKWSLLSVGFDAVFRAFTVFGTIFLLFLNECGFSKSLMGFLLSLLPFSNLLSPFIAGRLSAFGNKPVHLFCGKASKIVISCLLFLPFLVNNYGHKPGVILVTSLLIIFVLLNVTGTTAYLSWVKEFVPDRVRGKYNGIASFFSSITSLFALFFAGYIIRKEGGLSGYTFLIGLGCLFGFASIYFMGFVPGGDGDPEKKRMSLFHGNVLSPFQDKNYRLFLSASCWSQFGVSLMIFTPLFLRERIGFSSDTIILLGNASILGAIVTSFLWGWMADRYGSRPVLMTTLGVYMTVSFCWFFAETQSSSFARAYIFLLYFFSGAGVLGRAIADTRLLYVSIMPEEGVESYAALFYACTGLISGIASLIAGYILKRFFSLNMRLFGQVISVYSILFVTNFLCQIVAIAIYRKVKPDKRVKTRHLLFRMLRQTMRWRDGLLTMSEKRIYLLKL